MGIECKKKGMQWDLLSELRLKSSDSTQIELAALSNRQSRVAQLHYEGPSACYFYLPYGCSSRCIISIHMLAIPYGYVKIAMERSTMLNGKNSLCQWPCSIAILVDRRVYNMKCGLARYPLVNYLVGGLEHFLFFHIGKFIIPIDELLNFRGVGSTTNQLSQLWKIWLINTIGIQQECPAGVSKNTRITKFTKQIPSHYDPYVKYDTTPCFLKDLASQRSQLASSSRCNYWLILLAVNQKLHDHHSRKYRQGIYRLV